MQVLTPLWGRSRRQLVESLVSDYRIIFSCVKWFSIDWLGRELNGDSIKDLMQLHRDTGLDLCGEQGEYHTLVLDAPLFKKKLLIKKSDKRKEDEIMYLGIEEVMLESKGV